ncbi:MAG: YdcF family protein [Anaerolineae bacterium]|jgi:uncharacterized SAM-binding protein YcdF (DUF218 family)
MRPTYARLIITAIVVSLLATLLMIREPVLMAIGDFLAVRDELRPADVIHVISGLDHRADYGIQLYQEGYGKRLFFTGGWCAVIDGNHAERGRERARQQGVPLQAIAIDGSWVTSTYSEVVKLQGFIAGSSQSIRSVIVVSDPYHMRRARWTYQRLLDSGISVQMAPVPYGSSPFERRWWTDKGSRRKVRSEYLKIVYYYLRYQVSPPSMREWLASLERN